MPDSRRAEALELAEQLLTEIEYSKLPAPDIAKKASRLARLLDDEDAMAWLRFEVGGYTPATRGTMTDEEVAAAQRSRRRAADVDGEPSYTVTSLGWLQAQVEASNLALVGMAGGAGSGEWAMAVENARQSRTTELRQTVADNRATIDAVVGAIYEYVSERYQELRFGATVETAFDRLREEVDRDIADIAPTALSRLSGAFENASSNNPEHWANAASTCRRLLQEVADALRPAGPDVEDRKMGEAHYVNRLVDWITAQPVGDTLREVIVSDLEFLGHRLDAVVDAGHKGAHADVSQYDASRYLVATYLTLGDILRLRSRNQPLATVPTRAAAVALSSEATPPLAPPEP
jgi:hypothetical protein